MALMPPALPEEVWALILGCAAQDPSLTSSSLDLGPCTPLLRLLVSAAATSRTLRGAAAAAAAGVELCLELDPQLPASRLSPLLAELCRGQTDLQLSLPLALTQQAGTFVAATRVRGLQLRAGDSVSMSDDRLPASRPTWLADCPYVSRLDIDAAAFPAALPPYLFSLWLDARVASPQTLSDTLIACLGGLGALQHLELDFSSGDAVQLPAHVQWPASLQTIDLSVSLGPNSDGLEMDLAALQKSSGCSAAVSITLHVSDEVVHIKSFHAALEHLAELGPVDTVWLDLSFCVSPEHQTLARICCRQFCWTEVRDHCVTCLPQAAHTFLGCDNVRLFWKCLDRPGSFCICAAEHSSVMVLDAGPEPSFQEPWAIWVWDQDSVQGLPCHKFEQLPSGWWVWRNAAAACLDMQEPYSIDEW